MKKIITLLLVCCMTTCALFGCGSAGTNEADVVDENTVETDINEENVSENTELPLIKVGFVCWGYSDLLSNQYKNYFDYLAENMNLEITYATAYSSEEHIETTENLISKGVDVILDYDCYDKMMQLCEAKGVYLAQYTLDISSPELKQQLETYSHWLGYSVCDDYETGCRLAELMYEQGCRNIATIAIAPGSSAADQRWNGVVDTVAKYEDMNIIAEYRNDDTGEFGAAVQNMISIYSDFDGIILMGGSDGASDSVLQALEIENKIGEIKLATVDIEETSREDVERGALHVIAGGQYPDPVMLFIPVYNAVTGSPMTDGPFTLYGKNLFLETEEDFENYAKYIEGDVFPYTFDELKEYLRVYNPDATFEDFAEFYAKYDIEEVVQRHAGMVE